MTAILSTAVFAEKYYTPAQYRWYLQSFDANGINKPSHPSCKVIAKGSKYPVVINPDSVSGYKKDAKGIKCVMIFRRGITGDVCATTEYAPGSKWQFPYLPFGFYSILIKYFDGNDKLVFSATCCLNILEDNTDAKLHTKPSLCPDIPAYSIADDKLIVSGLAGKEFKNIAVHVIGRDLQQNKLFEKSYKPEIDGKSHSFKLPGLNPGQFVALEVFLETPEKVTDKAQLFYFKRGVYPASDCNWKNITQPKAETGTLSIHENQIIMGRYKDNLPGLKALVDGMKKRDSNIVNLMCRWINIEPVSGVYNWTELDKYVKYFTENKVNFGMFIGVTIFDSAPYDLWGEWMMDSKGECQVWRNLCIPTPASKKYRKAVRNFIIKFYERYGNNPYFKAWIFMGQGIDSGIFHDYLNRVTDYSPWARKDFVDYLKTKYKTTEELNAVWNSNFSSWQVVNPPLPAWKKKVDISQPWIDFSNWKMKVYLETNTRLFDPAVRKLDKSREIGHYLTFTGPIEYFFNDMIEHGSQLSDGGGESSQMIRMYALAANRGVKLRPESHFVPPCKRLDLQDLVTNSLRYGMKSCNIGLVWNSFINWHVKYYPAHKDLQDSMGFWTSVLPVLRSIENSTPISPPVGFILSWDDLFYRTRIWRWFILPGEELQRAAGEDSLGNVPWLSGITPDSVYDRVKMLVCDYDNQVFSKELLAKLERFVNNGGSLVICGTAGEYTVGSSEKFLWKKRLHFPADKPDSKGIIEWKYGKGRVIYSSTPVSARKDGKFLVDMMHRCGIKRLVVSSNPAVQGFILKNGKDLILVVSAFNGFGELRRLKKVQEMSTTVRLPSLPEGEWTYTSMFPAGKTHKFNAKQLREDGVKLEIKSSGLMIIKLSKKP